MPVRVVTARWSHLAAQLRRGARSSSLARMLGLVGIAAGISYLTWRVLATLNLSAWWLSIPLILAECHALAGFSLFVFSTWDPNSITPATPVTEPPGRVAALIATYNESLEILLPTIAACQAMEVAHETWVLDDGDRPEVEALAAHLGVRYLTRPEHTNAKAGNLNHALSVIDADFIAVFDADHVPASTFLEKTLGYFTDERVALVQTPQDFYNLDSFVHADDDHASSAALDDQHFHEEALFYRVIQPGKNRWDGAFWCGTNAVLRVAALREVGGVATGSVTEDIHTTIRLHRRGWKSVYHNEVIARGLAAATAAQFQLQRHRWGLGAMQVIRQENPIFRRGLSLRQRISYLATLWAWFDAWRTLAYLLLPAAVLFSGVSPIQASAATFLWAFGASFLVQQLAMVALGRGYHRPFSCAIFDLVRMTPNLMATLTVIWPREIGFHVTPKGRTGEVRVKGPVSGVLIAALALQLISAVWFGLTFAGLTPTTYHTPWSAYGAVFWLAVNTVLVLVTMRRVHSVRFAGDLRRAVRFEVGLDALFGQGVCRVLDMSVTGARLALPRGPVQVSEAEPLSFVVRGRPVDLRVRQVGQMHMDGQQQIMHVDYVEGQLSARATLALALFRPEGEPQRQDHVPEFTLEVPSLVDAELHAAIAQAAATLNGADYDTRGGEPPRA